MKFLILKSTNPYYNLAVEEYFFEKTQDDVFILWQNDKTVVIGKNQNVNCELNFDFVNSSNIKIARRITGGGAVYHDLGNLNFSFICKSGKAGIDFASFCEPIIEALRSFGLDARLNGRNDIEVGGKKISGNAQYTKGGRTLHHGTLLFDTDLSVLSSALSVDEEKLKSKAIKSTRSRVANIKSFTSIKDINEFITLISSHIINRYSPEIIDEPQNDYIEELEARNSSDEWLFPKSSYLSSYTVTRKHRYPFGTVEVALLMTGRRISSAKIFGDFFGTEPIEHLEKALESLDLSDIPSRKFSVDSYIQGMSDEEFTELIINTN